MGFFGSGQLQGDTSVHPSRLPRCGKCGLAKGCFSPRMPPTGDGRRKILFIAEAPGEEEDRQGTPLIGKSGQFLRHSLRSLNLDLEDCWKTNAVLCRPPENKINDVYVEACRPTVWKTIRELRPSVIVLLGLSAVSSVLSPDLRGKSLGGIGRWLGWRIPSHTHGAWICPTYHPAYLLRMNEDPVLVRIFEDHLKAAISLEGRTLPNTSLGEMEREVEVILSPKEARSKLRDLAKREGLLAFDYETTGLKPDDPRHRIVSCSFSLDGMGAFAVMIDERNKRLLSKILRNPRLFKIASNLKFEERWTRRKLGHPVSSWHWDTMLASHVLDNRNDITSVKFQAFVRFGIPDYDSHIKPYLETNESEFNRIEEIPPKILLLYNGLDSLLEYQVAERQMEELK